MLWGTHKTVFGSFSDKIALNRQLLRLKDYNYWKLLGQRKRQLHKEMDPTVKIESNYSPKSHWSDACAVVLRLCFDLLLCLNKHKIRDREIIFENVYSKTCKFILKCNSCYTSSIAGPSTRVKSAEHGKIFKTISVTNLSAFSNNFLKSKVNDTFLMT